MSTFLREQSDLRQAIELFSKELPPTAPIRGVLVSADIEKQLTAFDRADKLALLKQKKYWSGGKCAWWAGLFGVIIVPVELLPIQGWLPVGAPIVVNALRLGSLILTFYAIILLGLRRSAIPWKQARGEAEKARAEVFRAIFRAAAGSRELLAQALACFKFAHLDWQIGFYRQRNKRLRERVRAEASLTTPLQVVGTLLSMGAGLLGLVAVLNFAAAQGWLSVPLLPTVLQWLVVPEPGRWQFGLNATASSLLALTGARFLLTHEEISNAVLYPWAEAELDGIRRAGLMHAEAAAANGNLAEVLEFSNKVQAVLDIEHRAWALTPRPDDDAAVPKRVLGDAPA